MKRLLYYIMCLLGVGLGLTACSDEHEAVDVAYVHFLLDDGTAEAVVTSDVSAVNTYYVYLSARTLAEPLTVTYEVEVGNGLTEHRDYELLSTERRLKFLPGVYEMPIRIRWIPSTVDASMDNTLTLRLTGVEGGELTLGMPGPDAKMRELRFTKK